jgi:GNAT superfamily N-acetyltransferase
MRRTVRTTAPKKTAPKKAAHSTMVVRPLTPDRWPDLEAIFAARGCSVARGCWCMFYRRSGSQGAPAAGVSRAQANRDGLRALVDTCRPPGLIAYRDGEPVGWVSLGPREDFARLQRSPVMRPVDDRAVWSTVCFVVPARYRRQGVAHALLAGAIEHARRSGATLLEAYPVDATGQRDDAMWFGSKSMFDAAGFVEVARRKPRRPVMRRRLRST